MKRHNGFVILIGLVVMGVMLFCTKTDVYAHTQYTDNNANDTINDAQAIVRNTQTPAQYDSGNSTSYRFVTGYIQNGDEDWYIVYLSASDVDCLLDVRGGVSNVTYEIYDATGTLLETYLYNNSGTVQVFDLVGRDTAGVNSIITSDDYYYIHVTSSAYSSQYYYFTIGMPQYSRAVYTHTFSNLSMSNISPATASISPFVDDSTIPIDSYAYEISISNVSSSVSNKRYFTNTALGNFVQTNTSNTYHLAATQNNTMEQVWGIRLEPTVNGSYTISPNLIIRYIKPER